MGTGLELSYFLPVTRLRLRCLVTSSHDTVLDRNRTTTSDWSVELATVADASAPRVLALEGGLWRDYSLELGLTEDGRLTKAGLESTGQGGKVLGGAVALAATAAALAAGLPPGLTLGGAAAGAAAATTRRGVGPSGHAEPESEKDDQPELDPVSEAYRTAHPAAAAALEDLLSQQTTLRTALHGARKQIAEATASDRKALRRYHDLHGLLSDVETELGRAKAHFEAWRKSTIVDTSRAWDLLVPLESLPVIQGAHVRFPAPGTEVERLFLTTGLTVCLPAAGQGGALVPAAPSGAGAGATGRSDAIHVRRPRSVELLEVRQNQGQALEVTAVHRELVMDAACEELLLPVRKSWFARRRTDVELSPLGAATGVSLNGSSSAAAVADATSAGASSATGSLEDAVKARAALDSLAAAGDEKELAVLKRRIAIEEQRLLADAQTATAADHARLARLKQELELAETGAKLRAVK